MNVLGEVYQMEKIYHAKICVNDERDYVIRASSKKEAKQKLEEILKKEKFRIQKSINEIRRD
jgi:hypothetical protein